MNQFYSEEEAQQILSMAARESASNSMTHEELVRAAAEMGISSEAIEQAKAEIERQKAGVRAAEEAKALRKEYRRHKWVQAWSSLGGFISATVFFTALWWITGRGYYWPIWILVWPVINIVSCGISALFPGPKQQRRYERWFEKRGRREMIDKRRGFVIDLGSKGGDLP